MTGLTTDEGLVPSKESQWMQISFSLKTSRRQGDHTTSLRLYHSAGEVHDQQPNINSQMVATRTDEGKERHRRNNCTD
ncbi:hypothetical protein [Thalassoglobus sp.]|uniref:hypothetical protein n=1 Tax=Thalassoglobus sp. TaxID=2795869 RepID=UPI003AA90679